MGGGRWVLRPTRGEAVAALASAALFAIAFPPFALVVPVLVCLVPLAVAVARAADGPVSGDSATRWIAGARLGFWFGIAGYGVALYWIAVALSIYTRLAILGYVAAVLVVAMVQALVVAATVRVRAVSRWPMAIVLPVCWTAGEMLLGHLGDLAFPWLPLGLGVTHTPLLVQGADVSGVHAVSFWIAAVNGLLADAWLLRARRPAAALRLAAATAVLGISAAYGGWRMRHIATRRVARVAVVQPDIPQRDKWEEDNAPRILAVLSAETRASLGSAAGHASADAPSLVLWPEAALPDYLFRHPAWRDTLVALATSRGTPLLAGIVDWNRLADDGAAYFNGAMLVEGDGRVRQPIYDKRRLVPIVERTPFLDARLLDRLGPWFGGYTPGDASVIYRLPQGRFGALICYESIFGDLAREYRTGGADFLVNLTNDAWFGRSLAPYQHLSHLVLRAVENRVGVVRAANTGFSGYIDPFGRVRDTTALFVRAAATYGVETTDDLTLYDRVGDWVGWGCVCIVLGIVARTRAWSGTTD